MMLAILDFSLYVRVQFYENPINEEVLHAVSATPQKSETPGPGQVA